MHYLASFCPKVIDGGYQIDLDCELFCYFWTTESMLRGNFCFPLELIGVDDGLLVNLKAETDAEVIGAFADETTISKGFFDLMAGLKTN